MKDYNNIPKEKFEFAKRSDTTHDLKLDTKPVSYMQDAFNRFKKNKGSVFAAWIIIILVVYAILAPIFSQYTVSYADTYFRYCLPKNEIVTSWGWDFWDGCSVKELSKETFTLYKAMGDETGHNAVKNQEYTTVKADKQTLYRFRLDTYHSTGCIYLNLTADQYAALQAYQDEYEVQVMYPTVAKKDRPEAVQNQNNANYYYKTTGATKTSTVYDENGEIIPVYKTRVEGTPAGDSYTSKMRIAEPEGYDYEYAIVNSTGFEVRVNYYEYYIYNHTQILKDGVKTPSFFFGTTSYGQDIWTCLASGARFSFILAIAVASVNLFVGAIYGSIEGYYGGVLDLMMERFSDILSAVPTMIVITLLKLHMGQTSQVIILFITFFMTGWIGMASKTRMQFYRFKNQEYVLAARTLGAKDSRLIFKHIFPNALGTLITSCVLVIPSMIFSETSLSYLGIINLSTGSMTSVGTLLAAGQPYLATYPHIIAFPSVYLALLMLSFNLFGNGLRDAFNPSLRGTED